MITGLTKYDGTFQGRGISFYNFRGRICVTAAAVGRALGYADEGRSLVEVITKQWADEMIPGRDLELLKGAELRAFLADFATEGSSVAKVRHLTVLYESGVDLVCIKTEKPEGRAMRRWLADEVLPRLRRGELPALAGREDASAVTWARLLEELDARDARLREARQQDYLKMLEHISNEIRVTVRGVVSPWAELVMALAARQQYLEKAIGTNPAEPGKRPSAPKGKEVGHVEVLRNLSARELARRLKTPPTERREEPKPPTRRRGGNRRPDDVRKAALQLLAEGHSQRETVAILTARGSRCSRGSLSNWLKARAPQNDPSSP